MFACFAYVVENATVWALAIFVYRMPEALMADLEMTFAIFINIMRTTYLVLAATRNKVEFKSTKFLLALLACWDWSPCPTLIILLLTSIFVLCSLYSGTLFPLRIFLNFMIRLKCLIFSYLGLFAVF